MADRTLTVNGQPFTFNRDRFAGVRTMTVTAGTVPLTDDTTSIQVTVAGYAVNSGIYTTSTPVTGNSTWSQQGGASTITPSNFNETDGYSYLVEDQSDSDPQILLNTGAGFTDRPWEAVMPSSPQYKVTITGLPLTETVTVDRTAQVIDSDRKGESRPLLSKVVGGAAAAYSLRDLNDKAGNNKVVRVRRASDNHERDFLAKEVSNGTLQNWVNTQVVAPLDIKALTSTGRDGDFLIAKAAYSLRSLGTRQATLAATGDTVARANGKFVVQVRRNSDDALKSFTATEITDGTLVNFVTQEVEGYKNNPSYIKYFGTGAISNVTTTSFDVDAGSNGLYVYANGSGQVIEFGVGDIVEVNLSATGLTTAGRLFLFKTNSGALASAQNHTFSNGDNQTISAVATAAGGQIGFGTLRSPDGGSITINSVKVTGQSGFVKTWYDQSVTNEAGDTATGNHAVQATAAEQPLIVSAGSLVADNGIDFDGSDDKLDMPTDLIASINSASAFLVAKSDTVSGTRIPLALSRNSPDFRFYVGALLSNKFHFGYQNTALKIELGSADTNKHLFTSIAGSSNAEGFLDGTSKGTVSAADGKSVLSSGGIGAINIGNFWDGTIQEIVVYNDDQTANRKAIEANIGEAYSITGIPAYDNEVDGFVETWYDQSGNSRDATQATASLQPKIVNAGTLVTATNSLPAIDFTSSPTRLARAEFLTGQLNSYFNTYQAEAGDSTQAQVVVRQGLNYRLVNQVETNGKVRSQIRDSGGSSELVEAGGDLATGSPLLHTTLIGARGSDGITIFVNGANEVSGDTADIEDTNFATADTGDFAIGAIYNSNSFDFHGKGQEFIFYNSDQSANRPAIEANINNQYDIY